MVLTGKRILVVEDEYMIAHDLVHELTECGATIVGPCATVPKALKMLDQGASIDLAVLDISLRDTLVYGVADRLTAQGVPIIFATGFDVGAIPERFRSVPRCEKPAATGVVSALVGQTLPSSAVMP